MRIQQLAFISATAALSGCVSLYSPLPKEGNATISFNSNPSSDMAIGIATYAGGEACTNQFRFPTSELKKYWELGEPFTVKGGHEFAFMLTTNYAGVGVVNTCSYVGSFYAQPNRPYRIALAIDHSGCGAKVFRVTNSENGKSEEPEPTEKRRVRVRSMSEPFCRPL